MAQTRDTRVPASREMLEEAIALARLLEPARLAAAIEFLRFLNAEQEDESWSPDAGTQADIRAALEGRFEGFLSHDQVWGAEDEPGR